MIQADGQGIDGEVASALIIFQCAIFHHRFARVVTIALFSGPHKLHLNLFLLFTSNLYLCRTEVLEDTQIRLPAQFLLQGLSHSNPTAHNHDINIVRWPFEEDITDISAHDITFHAQLVSYGRDLVENLLIKDLC